MHRAIPRIRSYIIYRTKKLSSAEEKEKITAHKCLISDTFYVFLLVKMNKGK